MINYILKKILGYLYSLGKLNALEYYSYMYKITNDELYYVAFLLDNYFVPVIRKDLKIDFFRDGYFEKSMYTHVLYFVETVDKLKNICSGLLEFDGDIKVVTSNAALVKISLDYIPQAESRFIKVIRKYLVNAVLNNREYTLPNSFKGSPHAFLYEKTVKQNKFLKRVFKDLNW